MIDDAKEFAKKKANKIYYAKRSYSLDYTTYHFSAARDGIALGIYFFLKNRVIGSGYQNHNLNYVRSSKALRKGL